MHHRILGAVILGVANFFSVVSTTTSLPPPSESLSASLSEHRTHTFRVKRRRIQGEHKVLGVVTRARKVLSAESMQDRSLSGEMSKDDNIFVRSSTSCHCGSPASAQRHGGILAGQKYRPCLCDRAESDGSETNASSDDERSKVSENGKGKGKDDKKGSKASKSAKSKKSTGKKDCGDSSNESKSSKSAKGKKHEGRGVNASQGNMTSGGSEVKRNRGRHKDLEETKVDGMNVTGSSANHTKPGVLSNITSQALIANDIGNKRTSKASASGRRSTSTMFVAVSVSISFLLIYVWNHRGSASQENEETTWQEQQQQHEQINQDIQNNLYERNVEDEYLSDASYYDGMEVITL